METGEYGTAVSCTPKRVVLGDLNNQNNNNNQNSCSPISPMANLKLLIKVATSPSNNQQQQQHQQEWSKQQEENARQLQIVVETAVPTTPQRPTKPKYTRQLRSLGFICKKFLQYYSLEVPLGESRQLSLGNLARVLEIEKRRVYDIINVVASLNMAVKVCKDRYIWYGNQYLTSVLLKLKAYALENKFDRLVESIFRHPLGGFMEYTPEELAGNCSFVLPPNILFQHAATPNLQFPSGPNEQSSVIEDNRICILCQKFVMLFLVAPKNAALNLNLVSKVILARDAEDKTGMRRLYDIANVLESLGLIRRRTLPTQRKPSFVYCGPNLSSVSVPPTIAATSNADRQDLLDVIPLDNIDADSNSESEKSECRLSDMLQVVCTELEKMRENNEGGSAAKKRLFSSAGANDEVKPQEKREVVENSSSFIRVPDRSFRLLCNTITHQEVSDQKVSSSTDRLAGGSARVLSVEKAGELSRYFPKIALSGQHLPTVKLNKIARPIRIVRQLKLTPSSDIQNGGIYKAVKNGNVVHLVKL